MKEKFIKYNIEDIINKKLYEEKVINESIYNLVRDKILKLLYELDEKT